jgi:hypothetical protein
VRKKAGLLKLKAPSRNLPREPTKPRDSEAFRIISKVNIEKVKASCFQKHVIIIIIIIIILLLLLILLSE